MVLSEEDQKLVLKLITGATYLASVGIILLKTTPLYFTHSIQPGRTFDIFETELRLRLNSPSSCPPKTPWHPV
jgi:hypothetical protein